MEDYARHGSRIVVQHNGVQRALFKVQPLPDGGYTVLSPYHEARQGWLALSHVDYTQTKQQVKFSDMQHFTASDRVKLSHHRDGFVELTQYLRFRWMPRFRKLQIAIPYITRTSYARSDVISQVTSQVQHQMTNAVAIRIRVRPKLPVGEWIDPSMQLVAAHAVLTCKRGTNAVGQIAHTAPRRD